MNGIKYGAELDFSDEKKPVDNIVGDLLYEIKGRKDELLEQQAHIENFPLGNEFEPDKDQQFSGMDQLRNISRNNYAKLIVDAVSSKCVIEGFRSAIASDEQGDARIKELFDRDDMGFGMQDAVALACTYRKAYLFVDPASKRQRVISPNNAAVLVDASGEPAAAIVLTREKPLKRDTLRVFVRDINLDTGLAEGKVSYYIATREYTDMRFENKYLKGLKLTGNDYEVPLEDTLEHDWLWWKEVNCGGLERVPVTVLKNKDNKNEFEDAKDTISRINHMIWQRVIISTMRAFRQRAVKGNFPSVDKNGKPIDYSELFAPGPGSLWQLPEGADMWESQPEDITSLLEAVTRDEKALGAQTKTPMNHFSDSVNNSAEGAASQKEAYYDKIVDRRQRFGSRLCRHTSILLEVNGDRDRGKIEDLEVIWTPIESLALTERTAAFQSLKTNGLALKTALREGMKMTPAEIKRAIMELNEDVLRQQVAKAINDSTPLGKASMNSGQGQAKQAGSMTQDKPKGDSSATLNKAKVEGRKANQ